jgi:hypothetical protein
LLPITILFGAVLVAIGPVIRRIRALTEVAPVCFASYQTDIVVSGNDEIGSSSIRCRRSANRLQSPSAIGAKGAAHSSQYDA